MKKQRHTWLSYFIMISMILLPFQYGQAMSAAHSKQQNTVCHDASMTHHQHDQRDAKQVSSNQADSSHICDNHQKCSNHHHCAKCQVDTKFANAFDIEILTSNEITDFSSSFSEFYSLPDLRPPRV
jgi:hypothetical protein